MKQQCNFGLRSDMVCDKMDSIDGILVNILRKYTSYDFPFDSVKKLPPQFHQFWEEVMRSANSAICALRPPLARRMAYW